MDDLQPPPPLYQKPGALGVLPQTIARPLGEHIASDSCGQGRPWPIWRDVLLSWIKHEDDETMPARYVTQHFNDLVFPFKWYQIQQVWPG